MLMTRARQHLPAVAGAMIVLSLAGCGRTLVPATPMAKTKIGQHLVQAQAAEAKQQDEPGFTAPTTDLGHFFQVDEGLYRGQQPTDAGFAKLKSQGMKTVVYLHFNKQQAAHEKQLVERMGMKFVHIPMSWITPPKKEQIDTWLKTVNDPGLRPAFVHCQHGRDRTGTLVGIYRIQHDRWAFSKAYGEMKEKGFRTFFLGLTYGVKKFAKGNNLGDEAYTSDEMVFAGL